MRRNCGSSSNSPSSFQRCSAGSGSNSPLIGQYAPITVSGRFTSQIRMTRCSMSQRTTRSGMFIRSCTRRVRSDFLSCDLSIIADMLLRILTLIALVFSLSAQAQPSDDQVLEAWQAWRRGDRAKLAQLAPQVRGHALEAWVAYWELRLRLDTATPAEVQDFFTRYAGTYQEDRLRNDWLL